MIAINPNEGSRENGDSMDDMQSRAKKAKYDFYYNLDKESKRVKNVTPKGGVRPKTTHKEGNRRTVKGGVELHSRFLKEKAMRDSKEVNPEHPVGDPTGPNKSDEECNKRT